MKLLKLVTIGALAYCSQPALAMNHNGWRNEIKNHVNNRMNDGEIEATLRRLNGLTIEMQDNQVINTISDELLGTPKEYVTLSMLVMALIQYEPTSFEQLQAFIRVNPTLPLESPFIRTVLGDTIFAENPILVLHARDIIPHIIRNNNFVAYLKKP